MKYFRKLSSEKCYLSPINMEDVEKYTEWVNDPEIFPLVFFGASAIGLEKEREILKSLNADGTIFAIVEKDTNKAIGNCGFNHIDHVHRMAEFGIFIGEKTFWNQGIGFEAIQLCLDYGFNVLNLHSVELKVISYNKRAIQCYEKVGFKLAGTRREALFYAGKYHDLLTFDILASEFQSVFIQQNYDYVSSEEAGRSKISFI